MELNIRSRGWKKVQSRLMVMVITLLILTFFIDFHTVPASYSLSSEGSPYRLPYPAGKTYKVTQGNSNNFSHSGKAEYAFDFDHNFDGGEVVTVRSGRVLYIKDDSNEGGDHLKYLNKANYVVIDHGDGTSALYLHLQYKSAMVKEGQEVEQGQIIARAGSTGYVTAAHLHFQVQETRTSWWSQSLPISFSDSDVLDKEKDGVPKQGKSYKSDNAMSRADAIEVPWGPTIKVVFNGPPELKMEWEKLGMADALGNQLHVIGNLKNISNQPVRFSDMNYYLDGYQVAFTNYGLEGETLNPGEATKIMKGITGFTEYTKVLEIRIIGFQKTGGTASPSEPPQTPSPTPLQNGAASSTATPMVAAGSSHTVGLKSDGTVVAVGSYEAQVEAVSSLTNIIQVAAGNNHTVGLKSNGTVVVVGRNDYGQSNVAGWAGIVQVAAGTCHTIGLKSDGTVVAVGMNYHGQCDVGSWTNITQVAASMEHTVGLKSDGTVVAVGSNAKGECNVGGWTNIVQVAAGDEYSVGLKSDGTVVAVGMNHLGQCDVGSWTNITQVAAGSNHTVGLKSDGTVVAVGTNYHGQLNVGTWMGVTQVSAGYSHTVGLKSDGTVVAVGWSYEDRCNVGAWNLFSP